MKATLNLVTEWLAMCEKEGLSLTVLHGYDPTSCRKISWQITMRTCHDTLKGLKLTRGYLSFSPCYVAGTTSNEFFVSPLSLAALFSKDTSAQSRDISEKAALSRSRSPSRLSALVFMAAMVSLAAMSSWWWLYTNDCLSLSSCRISVMNSFSRFSKAGNDDVVISCS